MNKVSALRRRLVCAGFALAFFMAALCAFLPTKAAEPPDTLKVYAQYWGDPDSAKLLKEFSRAELDALSYSEIGYEGYYCNVTNVNTVMRIHARGFKLAEFLSGQVGLDLNSIRQLDFHTTDVAADARFVSKGREELLDSSRYYYPNLIPNSHMDEESNERVVDDAEAASEGAVQVPTIIATVQYATKNPNDDLTGEMTADTSFRLCAGHPDSELWNGQNLTKSSFESAKWIDEIYVVLAGAPPEEPTEPDEEPTQPDEKPTGSDITPPSEDPTDPPTQPEKPTGSDTTPPTETPTNAPTQPEKPTGSNIKPASTTRRRYTPGTTRRVTQRTVATTRRFTVTNRTVTMTTRSPYIAQPTQPTTAVNSENMGQLVVEGYDSMIQWKQDSPDGVTALQKPLVKTSGVRNALLMFLASFAAGAGIMYTWFKKEK